jgi:hypothetical protein
LLWSTTVRFSTKVVAQMANTELDRDLFRDARASGHSDQFLFLLRRHLPLRARAGARIVAKARAGAGAPLSSHCSVIQVYDAGDAMGLLCHLEFADHKAGSAILVAPIAELSFDRGSPVFREIAAYQKSRRAGEASPRACAKR